MPAWILLSVSDEERVYHGVPGYGDDLAVSYHWDSEVNNHAALRPADRIVIRDNETVLGASVIDTIKTQAGTRLRRRCPNCARTDVRPRTTVQPEWRCYSCGTEFHEPAEEMIHVTQYTSDHSRGWVDLTAARIPVSELTSVTQKPNSINSLRPATSWDDVTALVNDWVDRGTQRLVSGLREEASPQPSGTTHAHGFKNVIARARRGQASFRASLLEQFGTVCAITGSHPEAVLEAAHLYRYADVGVHHDDGGLLLRADLHRLLDRGLVRIDPISLRVDLAPELRGHAVYGALHGRGLNIELAQSARHWLQAHWDLHAPPDDP